MHSTPPDPTLPFDAPDAGGGPPEILGFAVGRELGRGGAGAVYLATEVALGRPVAIKTLLSGAGSSLERLRFRVEAEAIAALRHPNVVAVHAVGESGGRPYLILDYCPGGSLADRVRESGPLPAREAVGLMLQVASAVRHAHESGVIHRDLKPGNVLLDADGTPRVADFGLAKRVQSAEDRVTQTGAILGTPAYMAPEQVRGEAATVFADVYALGAILFELLTGSPPHRGATVMETLHKVLEESPLVPGGVERGLAAVCLKCLAKRPNERYASAAALAADLEAWRDGRPLVARPPSAADQMRAWLRANVSRVLVAALIGLVCSALASFGPLAYQMSDFRDHMAMSFDRLPRVSRPATLDWMPGPAARGLPLFWLVILVPLSGALVRLACWVDRPAEQLGLAVSAGLSAALPAAVSLSLAGVLSQAILPQIEGLGLVSGWALTSGPAEPERLAAGLSELAPEARAEAWSRLVVAQLVLGALDGVAGGTVAAVFLIGLPVAATVMIAGSVWRTRRAWWRRAWAYAEAAGALGLACAALPTAMLGHAFGQGADGLSLAAICSVWAVAVWLALTGVPLWVRSLHFAGSALLCRALGFFEVSHVALAALVVGVTWAARVAAAWFGDTGVAKSPAPA